MKLDSNPSFAASFLSLFTSAGTLVCCALPALFVSLGAGAALAGLVTEFPQLVWLSENKPLVFSLAGLSLLIAGGLQWRARRLPCPLDPVVAQNCMRTRRVSEVVYFMSVGIFFIGAGFAFLPQLITGS